MWKGLSFTKFQQHFILFYFVLYYLISFLFCFVDVQELWTNSFWYVNIFLITFIFVLLLLLLYNVYVFIFYDVCVCVCVYIHNISWWIWDARTFIHWLILGNTEKWVSRKRKETIFHVFEPERKKRKDFIFTDILFIFVYHTFPLRGYFCHKRLQTSFGFFSLLFYSHLGGKHKWYFPPIPFISLLKTFVKTCFFFCFPLPFLSFR